MGRSAGAAVVAGILSSLLGATSAAEGRGGPDIAGTVLVRVYDYAALPQATLTGAEAQASRVLRKAGLEAEWLDCPISGGEGPLRCLQPLDPTEITLRVLPDRAKAALPQATDVFGFALVPEDGSRGVDAAVFRGGIELLTRLGPASASQVLGHVIAHEIGHLLLGSQAHSASGIMRPHWSLNDLEVAARGGLVFTADEGPRLRAAVSPRPRSRADLRSEEPAGGPLDQPDLPSRPGRR